MKIHPILLLRIYKVCEYYMSLMKQIPLHGRVSNNRMNMRKQEADLAALLAKLKEEEEKSSSGGGGGGTLKGLRGDEVQRSAYKDAISTKRSLPTKPF